MVYDHFLAAPPSALYNLAIWTVDYVPCVKLLHAAECVCKQFQNNLSLMREENMFRSVKALMKRCLTAVVMWRGSAPLCSCEITTGLLC